MLRASAHSRALGVRQNTLIGDDFFVLWASPSFFSSQAIERLFSLFFSSCNNVVIDGTLFFFDLFVKILSSNGTFANPKSPIHLSSTNTNLLNIFRSYQSLELQIFDTVTMKLIVLCVDLDQCRFMITPWNGISDSQKKERKRKKGKKKSEHTDWNQSKKCTSPNRRRKKKTNKNTQKNGFINRPFKNIFVNINLGMIRKSTPHNSSSSTENWFCDKNLLLFSVCVYHQIRFLSKYCLCAFLLWFVRLFPLVFSLYIYLITLASAD